MGLYSVHLRDEDSHSDAERLSAILAKHRATFECESVTIRAHHVCLYSAGLYLIRISM